MNEGLPLPCEGQAMLLTDTLCTNCGLCCDGTLLGDVELSGPAEAARLEAQGIELDDEEIGAELLPLPCAALCGTRCSIYPHRPKSCRQFECRLLREAHADLITVEESLADIARARAEARAVELLLATLATGQARLPLKERYAEAMADRARATFQSAGVYKALTAAMDALAHTIRTRFLDPDE